MSVHGAAGVVALQAARAAHVVIVSGAVLNEPLVFSGPFVMNDRTQIAEAIARFEAGDMGRLAPASAD